MNLFKTDKKGWEKCPDRNFRKYIKACKEAFSDDKKFANFKRNKHYQKILEGGAEEVGKMAIHSIQKMGKLPLLHQYLDKFKENDIYGNPILTSYEPVGIEKISSGTLRYVNTLFEIQNLIGDFEPKYIIEVGGGYGGLCKIMSVLYDFLFYALIDLSEVNQLTTKYLGNFKDLNKRFYSFKEFIPRLEGQYDLFISDSAFAECSLLQQKIYTKIAQKSKFVYVTFNTLHTPSGEEEMHIFMDSFPGREVKSYYQDDKIVVTVT